MRSVEEEVSDDTLDEEDDDDEEVLSRPDVEELRGTYYDMLLYDENRIGAVRMCSGRSKSEGVMA